MAIPTRKSLWDQIKDLLSPSSQAVNQSQIQSTAQQKQNQIKSYTDLYYTNPYTQQSINKPAPTGDVNSSGSPVSYGISNPFETVKEERQQIFKPDYSNSFVNQINKEAQTQPLNLFTPLSRGIQDTNTDYNYSNPVSKLFTTASSLINPLGTSLIFDSYLNESDALNKRANDLYNQAMQEKDPQRRNELLRQSIQLSSKAGEASKFVQQNVPSLTALPKLATAGLVNFLPQMDEVNEQVSRNVVDEYRKQYPDLNVPTDIPIKQQELLFNQLIQQREQQKFGEPKLLEGYKEPTSFTGQLIESSKQFFYNSLAPGLLRTTQYLARDLNLPWLSNKIGEISSHAEAYANSRVDLNAPDEFKDLNSLAQAVVSDPMKYIPMALGRFFGEALPYTLTTVVATTATRNPAAGLAFITAMEKGNFQKELLDKGVDPDKAEAAGNLYGLLSAAIEQEPFGGYTPQGIAKWLESSATKDILKSGWKRFLEQAPKTLVKAAYNAIWEGNEEVAQNLLSDLMKSWLNAKDTQENTIPKLAYSWLGGFIGALPLGVTNFESKPTNVPAGLSIQEVNPNNLPDEIADLIGKTEPNGATIKQIVPALNGYEATIVTPKGNEFKTIINGLNLNSFIQTYNPSPTTSKIDSIKSQLRDLYYQLDATDNPIEQAVIQTKIDKLQNQIDELTSKQTAPQTNQESQPEVKPKTMSLEEYLNKKGISEFDYSMQTTKYGRTARGQKRIEKQLQNTLSSQIEGINEYYDKVKKGEIIPPTTGESLMPDAVIARARSELRLKLLQQGEKPDNVEKIITQKTAGIEQKVHQLETEGKTPIEIEQIVRKDILGSEPEIKPAETLISQPETFSETSPNEQNSPLEQQNTQEDNTQSRISRHSQRLATIAQEEGEENVQANTYNPINVKEEFKKVEDWFNNNPDAINDVRNNNIPPYLNTGSLFAYAFKTRNLKLILAILNNTNLSKKISDAAQTLTTLNYGRDSVLDTIKIFTGIQIRKADIAKKILNLNNNSELYNKIGEYSNNLTDEIKNTVQRVAEQSVPKLGEILYKERVNLDSLISMPSDERVKFFAKYFGADAYKVNQSFENAVLSKKSIENGVVKTIEQWAKRQKLPTSTQEIIDTTKRLLNNSKIDKAFSSELSYIVNQVVNKAVGIYIAPEEAEQLQQYIDKASEALQNFDYENNKWKTPEDGIRFGLNYYRLQNYIRSLTEANNPNELARQMITELKITQEKGIANLIGKTAELTLKNLNDLFTSIVANGDVSIVGRQMRNLIFTHPGIWFKVLGANIQALGTDPEQFLESVYIKFYSDPNFVAGRMNDLIPHTFEEMPAVKFLYWAAQQKIGLPLKVLTRTAAAFEGGYIRGLQLNADYVYRVEQLRGLNIDDKKVIKDVQDYVKTFLGQAPLGNSKFWQSYSFFAWAAGLTKSHLLTGYSYLFGGAPESVRGLAAKEAWMSRLGTYALMLLFTYFYGKKRVQWDPRASTYSGVQLSPTKDDYIILNPYNAEDVLIARMLIHIYNKMNPDNAVPNFVSSVTGKEYNTANAGFGEPNMWDVIVDFAEGKSKPMIGLFINFLKNEAFGGKQLTAGEAAKRVSVPITGQNTWDVIMNTEAGRKAYGIITDLANALGVNTTHMIRSTPWDYSFTQEVYRLAEKYPDISTAYHLGFLQANKVLTPKENQEIFDYIVKTVNKEGVPFIQSQTYQQLPDDMKAKAIAKSLDGIREDAYERLMYNQIVNAPPQQLDKVLLHFYRAGLFTSNRLKDMWNSFTPEMREKILDIVNNKILPLEKKS